MKLIAKTRLQPQPLHSEALQKTLEQTNAASNYIASIALEKHITAQSELHHAAYHDAKQRFDLSAQMTIKCVSRVADLARQGSLQQGMFTPQNAIAYDDRILTWDLGKQWVSIWTVHGRKTIAFECGPHQRHLLQFRRGESDLIPFNGDFFLFAQCDIEYLTRPDTMVIWE